jgi:hypothetical protein
MPKKTRYGGFFYSYAATDVDAPVSCWNSFQAHGNAMIQRTVRAAAPSP